MRRSCLVLTILFIFLMIGVAALYTWVLPWALHGQRYSQSALDIRNLMKQYVLLNNGCLPQNEEDLIKSGLLRRQTIINETVYEFQVGGTGTKNWHMLSFFSDFEIAYGRSLSDFEINTEGELIFRDSNERALIISLPDGLDSYCYRLSLDIYNTMLSAQEACTSSEAED